MYVTSHFGNMVLASVSEPRIPSSHDITLPLWEERDLIDRVGTKRPSYLIAKSGIMAPMTAEWGASHVEPKCY